MGRPVKGTPLEDIGWFKPDGDQMSDEDWESGFAKSVAVFLNGDGIREPDSRGEHLTDQSFFLLFNAHHESLDFAIPDLGAAERWHVILDTSSPMAADVDPRAVKNGESLSVEARSVVVLQQVF
jgi:glycogen operon protein